jgi:signal peptidase I
MKKRVKEISHRKESKGRKLWNFLWKSDSVWSWIVDFIIIFLLVKFVIFPMFGLVFGTSLPFVIIESGSMEHKIVGQDNAVSPSICGFPFDESKDISSDFNQYWSICGPWYEEHNITGSDFENWHFMKGMNKGDIIIVKGLKNQDYGVGDVIIFSRGAGYSTPIIHRIIAVNEINGTKVFSTKGDHNGGQHPYEQEISEDQVIGKAVGRIPKLGWVKLFFTQLFQ